VSAVVAIVGTGITGLSTAFDLGERNAERIVVHEREGIGSGDPLSCGASSARVLGRSAVRRA
jgi:glycine/D-amino acid oxidase-like deaminating enzyme